MTVNNMSEPGLPMRNVVELFDNDSNSQLAKAAEDTPICCWDTGTIIYVDQGATGGENGINWANAYTDLQNGLYRAANTTCGAGPLIRSMSRRAHTGRTGSTSTALL